MILIVTSDEDPASANIRGRLLEAAAWEDCAPNAKRLGDAILYNIGDIHITHEGLDDEARAATGRDFELVIYASRHKSASGKRTLTVHPVGNYGSAEYGGKAGTLPPSAPREMTAALRALSRNAKGVQSDVSFEVTHHGPLLRTPAFYIEIGSSEEFWGDAGAASAIARTILEAASSPARQSPIAIGIGGGHYAPRFTEVALSRDVAFGHMVPGYALEEDAEKRIEMAMRATPGVTLAYFHKKAMPKPQYRALSEHVRTLGLREVSSGDIPVI